MISTFSFLIKGLLIGFIMMLAIGPIALLCVSRTIEKGKIAGFAIGLGAATADGLYGFVAAFGLTFLTSFLTEYEGWIRLIGGFFLLYLGIRTFLIRLPLEKAKVAETDLIKSYLTTFFLTLTSPMTILIYMTVFAGLGLTGGSGGSYLNSSFLVLGIFLGSALFYFILSSLIAMFGARMTNKHFSFGHKLSGIIIGGFGIVAIIPMIFS